MEAQAKLTRTQSSLLRSSPTIRSSIQSINSIPEMNSPSSSSVAIAGDEDDRKPHRPGKHNSSATFIQSSSSSSSHLRLFRLLAVAMATVFLSFVYLKSEVEISTSEYLLLALILIAVALFFAGKNKQLIDRSVFILKQIYNDNSKKFRFSRNRARSSVEWYIGCEKREKSAGSGCRSSSSLVLAREGVEFYSNGDFYEGEFHKGKPNGNGVYTYLVNGRYEGDWVDGSYDGYGIESWARGSKYRGQYRQGLRHGFGLYRFYTGDSYAGEWCNGQYHGVGMQSCSDGSCYVGEFKCGVKHGLGCYHFRNGDRFGGEYFSDRIHGYGVYHFANGHCYEGSWHEGRKQGFGMYTFRNGETKCGEWHLGTLKNPALPFTDSVLRAVQAARKAAENAIHLTRGDDQVNKAVRAANRAATAARVAAIKAVQNRMEGKCMI